MGKPLPTRLIDLGIGDVIHPRVCESANLPTDTKYITISHCWGNTQPLTLRNETLQQMQRQINVRELPKHFKEAMETARRLGVQYVWIDSLCIIQNDNEDWKRESKNMGNSYYNALLNIAISRAPDGRYGCFTKRDYLHIQPCRIEAKWTDHPSSTLYGHDPNLWNRSISDTPLFPRAWVTQETVLAPRVLYFGRHQMLWECMSLQACELWPGGIPRRTDIKLSIHPISILNDQFMVHEEPSTALYQLWDKFVKQYSRADLTFPEKDKLYAISGLARLIGIEDEYLDGLWRKELPRQLLWSTGEGWHRRPAQYRAPSWSWASIDGSISPQNSVWNFLTYARMINYHRTGILPIDVDHILMEVVHVHVENVDGDSFGPVKFAELRVRGPLLKTTIFKVQVENPRRFALGNDKKVYCDLFFDINPPLDGTVFHCLIIQSNSDNNPTYHGIVLEPTSKNHGEYYRSGYFAVRNSELEGSIDAFEKMLREPMEGRGLSGDEFEALVGVGDDGFLRYQISLV